MRRRNDDSAAQTGPMGEVVMKNMWHNFFPPWRLRYVLGFVFPDVPFRGPRRTRGLIPALLPLLHPPRPPHRSRLKEATGREVVMWDERRTTVEAHNILSDHNYHGKKRKDTVDAVAASLILEGYLAFRGR